MNELPHLDAKSYEGVAPFAAFDIETAELIPEDRVWHEDGGMLGITCMALYLFPDDTYVTWVPEFVAQTKDAPYAPLLSAQAVRNIVGYLDTTARNYNIVGWNSTGFDMRVIAAEMRDEHLAQRYVHKLTMDHIDPGFQMLCQKGFMVKLDRANVAMGGSGKLEGVSGADAPQMWASGNREAQEKVLHYVKIDAFITAETYARTVHERELRWITGRGSTSRWTPKYNTDVEGRARLLTVAEANKLPEPDTSWMDEPILRENCYGWAAV